MRLFNEFNKVLIKSSKGQVLVEMALAAPVLFLLVTGAIDFANMAFTQHRLITAAHEGTKIISQAAAPFDLVSCANNVTPTVPPLPSLGPKSSTPSGNPAPEICGKMTSRATSAMTNAGLETKTYAPTAIYKMVQSDGTPGNDFLMGGISIDGYYVHTFKVFGLNVTKLDAKVFTFVAPLVDGDSKIPAEAGKRCLARGKKKQCF